MIGQFFTLDALIGLALGYLLGSIPFGLLLTRAAGLGDIRSIGSGNIGATNVLRTGSKKVAAATLLLDALKGAAAVIIAARVLGPFAALTAGLGAVLGHCFPLWLKFRRQGRRRDARRPARPLPPFGIAARLLWLLFAVLFRISSLSALMGLAATALLAWLAALGLLGRVAFAFSSVPFAIIVTAIVALVMAMHHENIGRLLAGTEPRIGAKK